jgi:2-polyprenyl-3-methyl-5-hydroxy-6-metoxy-1,4-benzoquinol methylase
MTVELARLAQTYLSHVQNRDWTAARAMCTRTATVWHNDGNGAQSIDDNIAGMQEQIGSVESMRYEIIRQFTRPREVLQQHVVHVVSTSMRGEVHAAVYFAFADGLIDRIEEYANFVAGDGPTPRDTAPSNTKEKTHVTDHGAGLSSAETKTQPGLDKSFWEQRWSAVQGTDDHGVGRPNETLTDLALQLAPGRALDAGCGQGADAMHLAERGWTVTAVDFIATALDEGRARAQRAGEDVAARIDWQQGDLNTWSPAEGAYDLVTAHYLHGVTRREDMFRRLAAAVRPGGTLLIVGHHPSNADTSGGAMPKAVFFTTADVTRVLGDEWTFVTVDDDVPRHTTDGEGRTIRLRGAKVRAQRRDGGE